MSNNKVLWLTGLSGAGKTTIANSLVERLKEYGHKVEHLDGDVLRQMFPGTGFSKEERNAHIKRVGNLCAMLEKHGITVVASFISPYREAREQVRTQCKNFVEIYVSTPLSECEKRDPKGLYKKVRAGEIKNFTGIDDPYEEPVDPEIRIDTTGFSVEGAVDYIISHLGEEKVDESYKDCWIEGKLDGLRSARRKITEEIEEFQSALEERHPEWFDKR